MKKILKWILIIVGIIIALVIGVIAYDYFFYPNDDPINPFEPHMVKKPAIYLYPLQDTDVSVKLNINGDIINDIPVYADGWSVFVTKEGIINGNYGYLFYEAKLNKLELPSEGWVVSYDDLGPWFDLKLSQLGLNEKEKSQFKEYWIKELPESNYYEIKLLDSKFLIENMNLEINPSPDSILRVEFYFKPIEKRIDLVEPSIVSFERKGFVVVEWGGILDS